MQFPSARFLHVAVALLACAAGTAYASQAATNYTIPMDVIDAGGADVSKSSNYLLSDSIGEPVVGYGASTNYILNSGYRQPSAADYLSMTCTSLVTIGSVPATGQKTGSGTCTVYTDAYNGYNLTWGVLSGSGGVNTGSLISEFNDTIAPFDLSGSGLVGYWKMDETSAGSTVKDFTVYGNNGTPNGVGGANNLPQPNTSIPYNMNVSDIRSLDFDGTDDYVQFAASGVGPLNAIGTGDFSISIWATNTATSGYREMVANWSSTGLLFGRDLAAGKLHAYVGSSSSNVASINYTIPTDGSWHHYALTRTSGTVQVYVDGAAQGSSFTAAGTLAAAAASRFGSRGDSLDEFWLGKLDEPRIYNRALTPAEIQALYRTPHTWSVATTENGWGSRLSSRSTDTHSKWGTDGGAENWLNIGDGSYSIITRGSATTQSGSTQILQFRAEVGSAVVQTAGTYRATATFTVVSY